MTSATPPTTRGLAAPRRRAAAQLFQQLSAAFAAEPELISACLEGADGQNMQQAWAVFSAAATAQAGQPNYADLSYHAAEAALAAGERAAAARLVAQALHVNPRYRDALMLAARIELQRGQLDAARRHLQTALASGADYPDVYALLGRVCEEEGDCSGAQQAYTRALALNPALAEVRAARAALAVPKGRERDELPA
jgi:tetratricopeptide (TPR) repeat protein